MKTVLRLSLDNLHDLEYHHLPEGLASLGAQPLWLSATCLPCCKLLAKTAMDKPKTLQRKPKCKGRDGLCLKGHSLPNISTLHSLPCSCKFKHVTPKRKTLHLESSPVIIWGFLFALYYLLTSLQTGQGQFLPLHSWYRQLLLFLPSTRTPGKPVISLKSSARKSITIHPVQLLVLFQHGAGAGEGRRAEGQHGKLFGDNIPLCWSNCDHSVPGELTWVLPGLVPLHQYKGPWDPHVGT